MKIAVTTPLASHRWRRVEATPSLMASCNENNGDFFSLGLAPAPEAAAPDF
jgi:hypothetical protein